MKKSPQSLVSILFIYLFLMVLKILYRNYRGAGSQRCNSIVNDMISLHKLDLMIITEPKVNGKKVEMPLKESMCPV